MIFLPDTRPSCASLLAPRSILLNAEPRFSACDQRPILHQLKSHMARRDDALEPSGLSPPEEDAPIPVEGSRATLVSHCQP
ncbi:hypothetical protein PC128_g17550 [Phytophthora cactorum]|nr:hypothetical protein PC120_g14736 [Phytophthora cactorum]KAG3175818.1 hypothetical protein PC128_g17550 [Phytophthora cactorum]KAG4049839.1 hypothetical protein PC123_g14903 [Phytophthora cactorum]